MNRFEQFNNDVTNDRANLCHATSIVIIEGLQVAIALHRRLIQFSAPTNWVIKFLFSLCQSVSQSSNFSQSLSQIYLLFISSSLFVTLSLSLLTSAPLSQIYLLFISSSLFVNLSLSLLTFSMCLSLLISDSLSLFLLLY
jgi:hypothetical protein